MTIFAMLFLAPLTGYSVNADANDGVILDRNTQEIKPGKQISFWPDQSGSASFDDARKAWGNGLYTKNSSEVISHGITLTSSYWFHLAVIIRKHDKTHQNWQLVFDHDTADTVSLFVLDESGQVKKRVVDTANAFYEREVTDFVPVINMPFNGPGAYEVFIQVTPSGPSIFPIFIVTDEQRLRTNKVENALLCFYYGALVVMALYNLFVFISTKLPSYLFYVIYVVNVGVFLFFVEGLGLAFIIPNNGEWNRFLINASGMLLFVSTVTFIRSFLKTKIRTPRLDKALFILPIVVLAFIPLAGTRFGALALIIISPLTILIILYSTIKVLNQGHAEAKLFLLGWLSLIAGICYQASVYMGLLPWTIFTKYAVHIGSFVEVVLIALALANQINTYKNQKEIAEEEAKRRLLERNETLIETNRLKNEFIATISHEMRTPLNGIVGSLDLASNDPEDLADHLNDALISSKNLGSIIDDILLLSELLSGDSESLEKEFNVYEIIDKSISAEEPLAKGKSISIEVNHNGSIMGMVKSDPSKMIKVIRHVLNNAIKFSPTDSSIQVNSLLEQRQEGELTLQVVICDSGPGIDPNLSESIFDAFRQADNSFRRSHGGLGIGLTLVKNLVKVLNGDVNIGPNRSKGTRVELVFPLKKVAKNVIKVNSALPVRHARKIQKILVVEDNPVNQKVLVAILSRLHYQVDTADNGKLAVEKCFQSSYDLIFMDCQMPEMDGFEATENIRKLDNSNNATLIIAVTANATEKDRQRCYQVGMDDFTKKPVRLQTIDNILKIHSAGNM